MSQFRFLADEDFDNRIIRGLRRRLPNLDIVRVQDTENCGKPDPVVLDWAANNSYMVLTRDRRTMTRFAYERLKSGKHMPGIFVINADAPIGCVIDDLEMIVLASQPDEYRNEVTYLPYP